MPTIASDAASRADVGRAVGKLARSCALAFRTAVRAPAYMVTVWAACAAAWASWGVRAEELAAAAVRGRLVAEAGRVSRDRRSIALEP